MRGKRSLLRAIILRAKMWYLMSRAIIAGLKIGFVYLAQCRRIGQSDGPSSAIGYTNVDDERKAKGYPSQVADLKYEWFDDLGYGWITPEPQREVGKNDRTL